MPEEAIAGSLATERLAWNGIGFCHPVGWRISVVEKDLFRMEDPTGTVLEIKWSRVRGSFSFTKHLKRLTKSMEPEDSLELDADCLPESWIAAVDAMSGRGFQSRPFGVTTQARGNLSAGKALGTLFYRKSSGLAGLIQFPAPGEGPDPETVARVLATFNDHTGDSNVPYLVFDLQTSVPGDFHMETFFFKPGHFRLLFARGRSTRRCKLLLDRIGPAKVALGGKELGDWAGDFYRKEGLSSAVNVEPDPSDRLAVMGTGLARNALARRLMGRGRAGVEFCARLEDGERKILAGLMTGAGKHDRETFDRVWKSYVLVPQE